MSRPRKYTPNTLKKAVNGYFDSISRLVPLTEKRDTAVSYTHLTLPTTPYV